MDGKGKRAETPPAPAPVIRPTGAITLFSPQGAPVAILHASRLTAFRTALASLCLVHRRSTVKVLTVFGAGLQAYWHVRLALMLRGRTVKRVNIITHRYSETSRDLLRRFVKVPAEVKIREGWHNCQFGVLTPSYVEYARLLKDQVRGADVIFCCTPSTEELFPASLLTNTEGRKKGRLLVAIGSYAPEMREIPLDVLRQAVRRHAPGPHFHKHAAEGGVVVVDTLDGALKEAGELIAAGLRPDQLVELGELVMLQEARAKLDGGGDEAAPADDGRGSGASSPTGLEFDKLDMTPGTPSMSSVFGSASRASSRASSPSRKSPVPSTTASSAADSSRSGGIPGKVLPFLQKRSLSSQSMGSESRKKDDHLAMWLQSGNVIYKSVGLGLMDLTVGMHLVQLAKEKGIGTHVDAF